MGEANRPVMITGIGLLSALGEGTEAHWQALNDAKPLNFDDSRFAPYSVHGLGEVDWSQQISRRDMRQMEPWQQIGTYAAGLALDDAGVKENEELCGQMDMIVAAGGGERDAEVDAAIMADARKSGSNNHDKLLNERLSNDLRPTLFLAQLSNLLAGNISIVHKVTGSSRTFMGEEGAGISAVKTAHARIASGQSDIALVGGAFNGEREDMMLLFELGKYLSTKGENPVWERSGDSSGFNLGSIGAFLVLESEEHAKARDARVYARLQTVEGDHGKRGEGDASSRLDGLWKKLGEPQPGSVVSAACGVADITAEEGKWLDKTLPGLPTRGFGTMTGHGLETQFPLGIALAALACHNDQIFAPLSNTEKPCDDPMNSVLVTTLGHHRAEGLGLVTKAGR